MAALGGTVSSLLELLELLESASEGGGVGNGCSVAAEGCGASGAEVSEAGLVDPPGNGNCSATEGFLVSVDAGVQGFAGA